MDNFNLKYNLFDSEIKQLYNRLDIDKNGQSEYEGDDGWLHDSKSVDIITDYLNRMSENRNISKELILRVLNDDQNVFPQNVKDFFVENVGMVINDKNKFTYKDKDVDTIEVLKDNLIDYIRSEKNFELSNYNKTILNDVLSSEKEKIEKFARVLAEGSVKGLLITNGDYKNVIDSLMHNKESEILELLDEKPKALFDDYINVLIKKENENINDEVWKNDELLEEKVKIYLKDNNVILSNEKFKEYIEEIKMESKELKPTGFEWVCRNALLIIGVEEKVQNEGLKIHNQKDFEKLSEFANKLGKAELNELQNILIQCEYDSKVLNDFTSAVDRVCVNKNMQEDHLPVNTIMIYDTKTNDIYDISMIDKNGNAKLSFEKFVNFLNDFKNDNLVCIQAKIPSFNKFEDFENPVIKGMFDVAKANGNKLMDFVAVNVEDIKRNGLGEYNFKSLIDKKCWSYKSNAQKNFKEHINFLEAHERIEQYKKTCGQQVEQKVAASSLKP